MCEITGPCLPRELCDKDTYTRARDTEERVKVLGAALKRGQRRPRGERNGTYKRHKQKGSNWKPWMQGTLGRKAAV